MKVIQKKIANLYNAPFPSTRTGALFNAFSYPTKISPESEALFIACHTNVGDSVLDPFGGSGTTGIATMLCDKPTKSMIELAERYNLRPIWGPRTSYVFEISTSGCMLGNVMCHTNHMLFEREAQKLLLKSKEYAENLYRISDNNGETGQIRHIIWTDVLKCPHCSAEIQYGKIAIKENPLSFLEEGTCPFCKKLINIQKVDKVKINVFDPILQKEISIKKRVPYKIYGITGKSKWSRYATDTDINKYFELESSLDFSDVPRYKIKWGELYRQGYHYGISHIHHFYSTRNVVMFAKLWSEINNCSPEVQDALKIFLLSYNSSHSTLMTRVVAKKNNKDFVLTGAQPGVLYISSLPVEKNIHIGLQRKLKTFVEALSMVNGSKSTAYFFNESSTIMTGIANESIDYVFTDPPFGDFIPYSEINQINECWLGNVTDNDAEVIINHSQGKELNDYYKLMNSVFTQISSKLKNTGLCTLVFHSAKAEVWGAIIKSYSNNGLVVSRTSILDKIQTTFKQTNSNVIVKGDPIILLQKTNSPARHSAYKNDIEVAEHLLQRIEEEISGKEISTRLFSKYIITCIQNNLKITLDAKYFFKNKHDK